MELTVQAKTEDSRNCPFCRAEINEEVERTANCPHCDTVYHRSCIAELHACSSCLQPIDFEEIAGVSHKNSEAKQVLESLRQEVTHTKPTRMPVNKDNDRKLISYERFQAEAFRSVKGGDPETALKFAYRAMKLRESLNLNDLDREQEELFFEAIHLCFELPIIKSKAKFNPSGLEIRQWIKSADSVFGLILPSLSIAIAILLAIFDVESLQYLVLAPVFIAIYVILRMILTSMIPNWQVVNQPTKHFKYLTRKKTKLSAPSKLDAYAKIKTFADLDTKLP